MLVFNQMKSLILKGIGGLVVAGAVTSAVIFAPQTEPKSPTVPQVSGESIEVPVTDSTERLVEPETETPEPKTYNPLVAFSNKVSISDLVAPRTEEEQDAQIDQNTIKNVEQDAKLEEHDEKIADLETKVNTPAPQPTPQPQPEPESTPEPAPIVKLPYFASRGGAMSCDGQVNGSSNHFGCYLKDSHELINSTYTLTLTNPQTGETLTTSKQVANGGVYLKLGNVWTNITFNYIFTLDSERFIDTWATEFYLKN